VVQPFLNETMIKSKSKNKREKKRKKKNLRRIKKDFSYKKEERFMNPGLNEIRLNGGMGWGFPLPFSMLLILLHNILNINYD